jgi:hypothetical protein
MSDDDKREQVRERLADAIGNGQIHPALADWIAITDDAVQGTRDRHEALLEDLAQRDREDREAREDTTKDAPADDDQGDAADATAPTPTPTPAKVAAAKAQPRGGNR